MQKIFCLMALSLLSSCITIQAPTANQPSPAPTASAAAAVGIVAGNVNAPVAGPVTSSSVLRYVGKSEDRVTLDTSGGPDGTNDLEFTFTHTFPAAVSITEMTLTRIEGGSSEGFVGWTTTPDRDYFLMKVLANGSELNLVKKKSVLGDASGRVTFRLFGAGNGMSEERSGTSYELLLVTDQDGTVRRQTFRTTL